MKTKLLLAGGLFLFCFLPWSAQSVILAVNSTSKTIAQLDATNGTVLNANFINLSSLSPGTIKGIIRVQDKIWISDQTDNVIYICNLDGSYSSTIPSSVGLSNIRGLNVVNNEVWVTNAGTANGATANSIRRISFAGASLGVYPTLGSPFDALDTGSGTAYITSFDSAGIQTMNYAGTVTGNFVNSGVFTGIQQITKLQNGNYLIAVFSNNSSAGNNAGVYHLSAANGSILNSYTVGGARGIAQMGNGNYLYTTGSGVFSLNPTTGATASLIAGSYQYLKALDLTLSVSETKKEISTKVYPNPTAGTVHISAENEIEFIEIYSLNGQLLKTQKANREKKVSVDISELTANTYLVKIKTTTGEKTVKIIRK
ncbi:T9SS type A sorting domain-containing protein [Chryseobacterium caseinilyticum]|uniref:T9SS type A sorting domain-containing protein n=1 Tax=Chryseobacterium caseinilyticum TaxID=2771428 RepID=A0ABR8ZB33_9FLAO|nr:T9SS type A sorting domain-containing protein [Chryseobacterium caseinilyticum]MBD8082534.1 T9SS type A sorting domain-containing protein [Chryseobacterium caseinilyticum]